MSSVDTSSMALDSKPTGGLGPLGDSKPPGGPSVSEEAPAKDLVANQCPPLWGPLSGLAWAGGTQGFKSWRGSCKGLGALLGGPWLAGETVEFVGNEAEMLRKALITASLDVLLGDPSCTGLFLSLQGAPVSRYLVEALRMYPNYKQRLPVLGLPHRDPSDMQASCTGGSHGRAMLASGKCMLMLHEERQTLESSVLSRLRQASCSSLEGLLHFFDLADATASTQQQQQQPLRVVAIEGLSLILTLHQGQIPSKALCLRVEALYPLKGPRSGGITWLELPVIRKLWRAGLALLNPFVPPQRLAETGKPTDPIRKYDVLTIRGTGIPVWSELHKESLLKLTLLKTPRQPQGLLAFVSATPAGTTAACVSQPHYGHKAYYCTRGRTDALRI
ncbi:hypothetical protein cyc_02594 [Cyclospora cayetanensis]|uniref:Uncharacterized protein n=1 Tax=Cyclospora cayetanensis TaxID=88456 RepID=A0A1D3CUS7_9EIME|nr:hypothetical protein cyc_02594 [Cyclospora cayetanensis]